MKGTGTHVWRSDLAFRAGDRVSNSLRTTVAHSSLLNPIAYKAQLAFNPRNISLDVYAKEQHWYNHV